VKLFYFKKFYIPGVLLFVTWVNDDINWCSHMDAECIENKLIHQRELNPRIVSDR